MDGWWQYDEVRILPVEGEMLNTKLTVVWDCNYKGNSKTSDKDVLWNNWEMIGYTKLRFGFGLGVSMTHTHTHTHTATHTYMSSLYVITIYYP